jgi:hypothetical protein
MTLSEQKTIARDAERAYEKKAISRDNVMKVLKEEGYEVDGYMVYNSEKDRVGNLLDGGAVRIDYGDIFAHPGNYFVAGTIDEIIAGNYVTSELAKAKGAA